MPNPSDSPTSPWLRVLAAVGGVLLLAGAIVVSNEAPAAAMGLERFGSCRELSDHLADAAAQVARERGAFAEGGSGAMEDTATAAGPNMAGSESAAPAAMSGDDGTNTQVAGVDELDIVEALADGRSLVARSTEVLLVSGDGRQVLDRLATFPDPRITFDEDRSVLWVVSTDWRSTRLQRVALQGDAFGTPEEWSVEGRLVDLRRSGATVHLVAVDDEVVPVEPGIATGPAEDVIPFNGTSPVPCDQVLHTTLPGGPATTLVARFTADGALSPTAATEVVGAGDNVLVTGSAVYISTPTADWSDPVTGIHRFDSADLTLTGSGRVAGRLLNQFSLDEHDGHLRVAVTHGGWGFGIPMPVDVAVDMSDDGAVEARTVEATPFRSSAPAQDETEPTAPEPTTSTTVADPTTTTTTETPASTTTTSEPATTTTTESTTTTTEATTTTVEVTPLPPQPDALNEIVVLDLEGSLDEVGRSVRFGHPGETIHGIRFAGPVAYAVTFLQTDPFYVVDLSDPTSPAVLGELEIPGFSAYLHPISATEVVGFGPGPDGNVLARLFDVSDPTAPAVVDTVEIGDESPIAHDHHALRTSGPRMLIPATDWVAAAPEPGCPPAAVAEAELDELYRELDEVGFDETGERQVDALLTRIEEVSECAWPSSTPRARIVTLTPGGGELRLESTVTEAGDAQRILPLTDGGYLVVGSDVERVSASGAVEAQLA